MTKNRFTSVFLRVILGALFIISTPLHADVEPYTKERFDRAQSNGKTVLLDFSAKWCPTCKRQGMILDRLSANPKYKNIVFLKADYDSEKALKKEYQPPRQSTFYLVKHNEVIGRQVAETNPEKIARFLDTAITHKKGQIQDFNQKEFEKSQKNGKTAILDFYAEWCPTCRKQRRVINDLIKTDEFRDVVLFKVDFDNASALKKTHKVSRQSTLIIFEDGKELRRKTGETQKSKLKEFILNG